MWGQTRSSNYSQDDEQATQHARNALEMIVSKVAEHVGYIDAALDGARAVERDLRGTTLHQQYAENMTREIFLSIVDIDEALTAATYAVLSVRDLGQFIGDDR